ncbi:MAG: PKD domain-containing protein [Alloprevotella sp.]|nr:PKD domain-containing protein [Alloprevotella sp.]
MRKLTLLMALATLAALTAGAQNVNRRLYPDYSDVRRPDARLRHITPRADGQTRPDHVNNAETEYFPVVINQDGGSCGSASRIYYMFTYEVNAWRRANGKQDANRYPTHFTWLLTNSSSGKEGMAAANGIPNVTTYGGATYSKLFGNQDCASNDFGWMQGYDKWYQAMQNRIERNANFPISVKTEEGRELVKNWIWNHSGDPDWGGVGGVCGIGVASGGDWRNIPNTTTNKSLGVVGKKYVGAWGKQVDHALTIVGYDDRIEFDLDGNGVAGEKDKDEVGAWIIVNSWGDGWCNKGFIYCPYKNAVTTGNSSDYYWPEIYYVRKNYRPLRTLKIKMEYSKRSELCLSAGVSQDTTATEPAMTVQMEHFKYAGDGDGDGVDAETPMLGRWTDGVHSEPMEFGYDITDLSAGLDTHRPVKYFFIIETKSSANGVGKVDALSFMDYEADPEGIEFPFPVGKDGVQIQTKGKKTIISYVVKGDGLNAPLNVAMNDGTLTWDAPEAGGWSLQGFNVYADGVLVSTLSADARSTKPTVEGALDYSVSARYAARDGERESNRVSAYTSLWRGKTSSPDYTRKFANGGFVIKNLLPNKLEKATIEFWMKPTNCANYNQQIGPGWGTFLFHTTTAGEIVAGWDTGNRFTTGRTKLSSTKWTHVALVFDGKKLTCYVNGVVAGEAGSASGGLPGMGDLSVGRADANGISAEIDEFRVWSTARTQTQISQYMYSEIEDPATMPGLLVELTMNEDANEKIVDLAQGHTIEYINGTPSRMSNYSRKDKRTTSADFTFPAQTLYTYQPIALQNASSGNVISFLWEVEGRKYTSDSPSVVFETPGEKEVKLTVTDAAGQTAEVTHTLSVLALPAPVASFSCPDTIAIGDRVSFINQSVGATSYEWSLPGAETSSATTTHLATSYVIPGRQTVTLTARNASGTSTAQRVIQINDLWPTADFTVSPSVTVKNTAVRFTDASTRTPRTWHWEIAAQDTVIAKKFKNGSINFRAPGVFDVSLVAANDKGANKVFRPRALVVCNADGKNALNFSGKTTEYVTFKNPVANRAFTVEYWLYAKELRSNVNRIGGTSSDFQIKSDAEGRILVSVAGMEAKTPAGVVTLGQWHHYAVVVNGQDCTVLKDCQPVAKLRFAALASENQPQTMQLGGSDAPMNAVIDELRIWNKALSQEQLLAYANNPISDVTAAQTSDALALYYQFNQSSGNVEDATSYAQTGTRTGFGPDGDAWSSSLGIFCLSEKSPEDITASVLTNAQAPFRHTAYSTNTSADAGDGSRYQQLETGTAQSTWVVENAVESGAATTEFYVDKDIDDALALMTGSHGFANEVSNLKLYQTVTLPVGYYVLVAEGYTDKQPDGCYLVAASGTGLPDAAQFASALAYAPLNSGRLEFAVRSEGAPVSLGIVANVSGAHWMALNGFRLLRRGTNDDWTFTGIETPSVQDGQWSTANGQSSPLYDLQGRRIAEPARGVYIRDGRKVLR